MPMSAEARAAASERMKAMRAKQKAAKADSALQEALAKVPFSNSPSGVDVLIPPNRVHTQPFDQVLRIEAPNISVTVDWQNIPIDQGQSLYAILKNEFEKAGKMLNARLMAEHEGYTCFMCKKHFGGRPGMTDLSYQDPATGLFPRVDLCGELCVINYHKMRIDMRTAKNIQEAELQRGA